MIAPVAQQNAEAAVVLGPVELAQHNAEVVDLLHGPLSRLAIRSPIVAQVRLWRNEVLASVTFKTEVPDTASKRLGLKLTLGGLIPIGVIIHHRNVNRSLFSMFDRFVAKYVYANLSEDGASRIVEALQQSDLNLDTYFSQWSGLVSWLESEFYTASQPRLGRFKSFQVRYLVRRLLREPLIKPAQNFMDAIRYWQLVDNWLGSPLGLRINGLNHRVRESLAVLATQSGRSPEELARLFVERGIARELFTAHPSSEFMSIAAVVLSKYLKNEEHVSTVMRDIRSAFRENL